MPWRKRGGAIPGTGYPMGAAADSRHQAIVADDSTEAKRRSAFFLLAVANELASVFHAQPAAATTPVDQRVLVPLASRRRLLLHPKVPYQCSDL